MLFICDVVKGYFSFVFPAPCPQRCVAGIADNNFTKSVECVLDMLFVFFCASHRKFPLPSAKSCGWLMVAFCDDKGRQHFCCRPLFTHLRNRAGLSTAGFSPFILTVDCSGWVCYLCFNHLPKEIIFLSTTFQENLLILGFPSVLDQLYFHFYLFL